MLSWIDWTIIIVYLGALLVIGSMLGSNQTSIKDYFVGGKSMGWGVVALSAMATQLSAVSFISAPAFVGLKQGGGLIWLSYELAVPIAMIILMFVVYPVFYKANIITIYEYLNNRFDSSVRLSISLVFQISRVIATGVTIHMTAIVFEAAFGLPYLMVVLIISLITIIYSTQGGIKAVIYADAIQMVIIFVGIFVCGYFALDLLGGWDTFIANVDQSRLMAVDFNEIGYKSAHKFGFLPMLLGGLFLYLSYYGCDQTQSQRLISTKNTKDLNTALFFNGIARFPMVLAYCVMGLLVGTFAMMTPEFMGLIPTTVEGTVKADYLLPLFIVNYLPVGVIGILLVAVLSAAMSSISSTINSLSAATVQDIIIPYFKKDMKDKEAFKWSLWSTVVWGILCTACVAFGQMQDTVIETINAVGSLFYGAVLGIFILGICTKRTNAMGCKVGLVSGLLTNFCLWIFVPELSWLWWNVTGFLVTFLVGYFSSLAYDKNFAFADDSMLFSKTVITKDFKFFAVVLSLVFIAIMTISIYIKDILI